MVRWTKRQIEIARGRNSSQAALKTLEQRKLGSRFCHIPRQTPHWRTLGVYTTITSLSITADKNAGDVFCAGPIGEVCYCYNTLNAGVVHALLYFILLQVW